MNQKKELLWGPMGRLKFLELVENWSVRGLCRVHNAFRVYRV